MKREHFTDEMLENILLAYSHLNHLIAADIPLFSPGGLHSMLEINHLVLCGDNPATRLEYHRHIMETRNKFYQNLEYVRNWIYKKASKKHPFKFAAGFYCRALSFPQLFIESNHRSLNILINYLLLSRGKPPFIIDSRTAFEYFEISAKIKFIIKNKLLYKINLGLLENEFTLFLKNTRDESCIKK